MSNEIKLDSQALVMFKTLVDEGMEPSEAERLAKNVQEQRMATPTYKIKALIHEHAIKIIITLLTAKASGLTLWLGDHV